LTVNSIENENNNTCYESVDDNILFHFFYFFVGANMAIAQLFPVILSAIFCCAAYYFQSASGG